MKPPIYSMAKRTQAVSWLLVLAFLALLLTPYHYHLHHVDVAEAAGEVAHVHLIEVHADLDLGGDEHDQDGHTLAPIADITLKNTNVQLPLAALILVLVLLLPLCSWRVQVSWPPANGKPPNYHRHTTPPLRAPPRV